MGGRLPKKPSLRQRRNRASTRATLPSEPEARRAKVKPLPARRDGVAWHPRVEAWWRSVWQSPMAGEYLDADRSRLLIVAELHQRFHTHAGSGAGLAAIAREIRLQEAMYGLSPMDRRRLQWEVERGEEAASRTRARRPSTTKDPRSVLTVLP